MSNTNKKFIEAIQQQLEKKVDGKQQNYHTLNYDPSMQLAGIRQFVLCLQKASANNYTDIEVGKHTGKYKFHSSGDAWADDCAHAMYFDATVSGAIVASFAQFFESLFTYEFNRVLKNNPEQALMSSIRYKAIHKSILKSEQKRAAKKLGTNSIKNIHVDLGVVNAKALDIYFDPHWYIDEENRRQKGISKGIYELCCLYGLDKKLPPNSKFIFDTIFFYRNFVMHNGVEWEDERIKEFLSVVKELPFEAFKWSKTNAVERIAFISDELINQTLVLCNACLEHLWFASFD